MRIFRHVEALDCLVLTPEYSQLAELLEIAGWESYAWIGRLFTLDNDYGEHWFDNEDEQDEREEAAERLGLDPEELLVVDPERFANGSDGPCNTPEFRKRFWTEVLVSLDLSEDLIVDKALAWHRQYSDSFLVEELEKRVADMRARRGDASA